VRIALPPAAVFESVWRIRDEGYEARITKKRVILKDTPNERVVYSQVRLPVVADRDYTLRLEAKRDVGVDVYQILYRTDNASGPKATTDHVRIELIRGGWTFEPDGEGGCLVTYFFLNDPGGVIPAFLARGYQGDVLASVLREALVFAASDAKKRDPFAH
jgi:hypothetical protein